MHTKTSNSPEHRIAAPPRVASDRESLRRALQAAKAAGQTIGLVPTMGALHEGHLSLVDAARAECGFVVVSIFVNPTQFAPQEDLRNYPRDLPRDVALLGDRGCQLVFAPSEAEMYRPDHATYIDVGPIAHVLEGEIRPTHFRGVATIVLKLFQLAGADRAYFGRKDYQQSLVVRQLVSDLNVPVEVRVCPIIREADGLAMSSRNGYLDAGERARAAALYRSLQLASKLIADGERRADTIRQQMLAELRRAGRIDVQYIAFLADGTVNQVDTIAGPTTIAIAAIVGKTRLIDNIQVNT